MNKAIVSAGMNDIHIDKDTVKKHSILQHDKEGKPDNLSKDYHIGTARCVISTK